MGESSKETIRYLEGMLEGLIWGAELQTSDDNTFNEKRWRDLYGSDIIYSSIPAYRSEDDKLKDVDPLTIMDWDHDREIALLSPGADIPRDRNGSMVFEDGTVCRFSSRKRSMYSLPAAVLSVVYQLRNQRFEMIRG